MYKCFSAAIFAAQTGWREWAYMEPGFYLFALPVVFLFGICIGSFLNVVIIRVPRGESLIKRSSHCMTCGAKIRVIDLIPVFSWLFLRGKCHSCGEKISARYPIVESLNGILYVANFFAFGLNWYMVVMDIFTSLLICIGFIDWDTMDIYMSMTGAIAALAVAAYFAERSSLYTTNLAISSRLIGAVCISVPFLLIALISAAYIKKKTGEAVLGIQHGDTILMACAGLLLGWRPMIPAAFIGILLAAIVGLIIKHKTGSSKFAFGPYLCIGLWIGAVFGEEITNWYIMRLQQPEMVAQIMMFLTR